MGFCSEPCCCLRLLVRHGDKKSDSLLEKCMNQGMYSAFRCVFTFLTWKWERESKTNPIFFIQYSFTSNKMTKVSPLHSCTFSISKLQSAKGELRQLWHLILMKIQVSYAVFIFITVNFKMLPSTIPSWKWLPVEFQPPVHRCSQGKRDK